MKLKKPSSVHVIATYLNAAYKGHAMQPVEGINEIHKVTNGDLTFVDVPKYYKKALESAATVILINQDVAFQEGKSIIISDDPFRDYNKLVSFYNSGEFPATYSNESREARGVDVEIGKDSVIYPGVVIGNHVRIGNNCTIYPNVVIYDHTYIGDNSIIHANTVLGSHAFYYKRRPDHFEKLLSCGRVIIENDVEIGACCTIDKGVSGDTVIGAYSKLDNHIHIGHGVVLGKRVLIAAQTGIGGKAIIGDDVIIWGQAGITKDITIGEKAIIAAQSGVSKSLEGGKLYFGSPAQEHRKVMKQMAFLGRLEEVFKKLGL